MSRWTVSSCQAVRRAAPNRLCRYFTPNTFTVCPDLCLHSHRRRGTAPHRRESQVSPKHPKIISPGAVCWEGALPQVPPGLSAAKPPGVAALGRAPVPTGSTGAANQPGPGATLPRGDGFAVNERRRLGTRFFNCSVYLPDGGAASSARQRRERTRRPARVPRLLQQAATPGRPPRAPAPCALTASAAAASPPARRPAGWAGGVAWPPRRSASPARARCSCR